MSKKNGFGKFIVFCAAVGAAAAGVYYYLSKRDSAIADEFDDDDFDDFEDFEDEDDDAPDFKFGSRKYVDIKTSDSDSEDSDEKEDSKDEEDSLDEADPEEEAESSEEPAASKSEEFFDDEK